MLRLRMTVLSFCVVLLAGCTSISDARNARGSGITQVYNVPLSVAWPKVQSVVEESYLDLIYADEKNHSITAQGKMRLFSYGENVAVFLKAKTENSTQIEVVSVAASPVNITATNWETRLHTMFASFWGNQ